MYTFESVDMLEHTISVFIFNFLFFFPKPVMLYEVQSSKLQIYIKIGILAY